MMGRRRDSDDVPEVVHTPDEAIVTSVPESDTDESTPSQPSGSGTVLIPDAPITIDATPVTPPKPQVPLRVFLAASGMKHDQLRGFASWATRQGLGPMTIADWHQAYKDHHNRPVK